MSKPNPFPVLLVAWIAALSLPLFLGANPAMAQNGPTNYALLVGAGVLCDSGDSSACPAVVKSADGASYEMSGAGTFNTQPKSVTATGIFTRKSSHGEALETGIWTASELVSFDFYGFAPDALGHAGSALGPPQFGPRRMPMLIGPMPAGGLAVMRVRLLPMWGLPRIAMLQVNCALGKVPAEHPTEGIRLTFAKGSGEFDMEVSGRTMFVVARPEANTTPTTPAPQGETHPAPAEVQR